MEQWSDQPLAAFRVKFFLDTNILSYLISHTYSGLDIAINLLKETPFADLVSSKYVIFELVDVRKKILYQEEVRRIKKIHQQQNQKWWHISKYFRRKETDLDPNVAVRYKEDFEKPQVDFHAFKETIKNKIEEELRIIIQDWDIVCNENILHDSLLAPTRDINLFTRISREDSLISVSSVWQEESTKENFLVLLTRDRSFVDSFKEIDLKSIFDNYDLTSPTIEYIESMQLGGVHHLNLTDKNHDGQIAEYFKNKIKELIIKRNAKYYLGKTIPCGNGPNFNGVVCFKLPENTPLNNNLYLTIIGKELDFIYSTRLPVSDFYDQVPIQNYPLLKNLATNISFKPLENNNDMLVPISANIANRLKESGNLVFINSDGA